MINYFIPLVVIIIIIYGIYKKIDIFDTFIIGVKEGMTLSINLFPTIFAMIIAITMITDSGIINYICNIIKPLFIKISAKTFDTPYLSITISRFALYFFCTHCFICTISLSLL